MSHYPIRQLFFGSLHTVSVAGSHLQIFATDTGKLLTAQSTGPGPVRAADAFLRCGRIVTTGDDKLIKVWRINGAEDAVNVQLESSREIPKKSSEIHISVDGGTILASDKFGDISAYPMEMPVAPDASTTAPKQTGAQDEKPRHGTLILGHTSVITAFTLTLDNQFIITGDRDEHIRISWYPLGYNIERYCLGHKKYISALHIPWFSTTTLVSGGGDPELMIWDWTSGTIVHRIPVLETVKPFVHVKGGRKSFKIFPRRPDGQGLSRKSKHGKKTRKAVDHAQEGDSVAGGDEDMVEDEKAEVESPQDAEPEDQATPLGVGSSSPGQVTLPDKFDPSAESFVIGKIGSVVMSGTNFVMFSAVGASSLFYFAFPSDPSITAPIHAVDFGSPVLDFVTPVNQEHSDVWVLTDNTWKTFHPREDDMNVDSPAPPMVRLVRWKDGKLVEVGNDDAPPPLLASLNSAVIEASAAEISALELYAALSMLPKSREEEADDAGQTPGEASEPLEEGKALNRKAIKKIAGRANTKARLDKAKEQGVVLGAGPVDTVAAPSSESGVVKRLKVDEGQ